MKRNILNIFILLLFTTAVLSCSEMMPMEPSLNDDMNEKPASFTLIISGTASDKNEAFPLEEIKITLHAAEIADGQEAELFTKTTYTDNRGKFTLSAEGFTKPVSCIITAEDPNGEYTSWTHEIPLISWDSSYNMTPDGTCFINDCDFFLEKAE